MTRLMLATLMLALAACAAAPPRPEPQAQIAFLDVASFDSQLASSLDHKLPRVDVQFYDRVTPSQLPPRLQRWLAEVEEGGGKVAVTPPPTAMAAKSPFLLVSAISSLWTAHKLARESSQAAELATARKYNAELKLKADDQGEVSVERVVFTPRGG